MNRIAAFRTAIVAMAALALSACGINSVPTKEEAAKAEWANVQSAYQRRADLIPNLVATARSAAASEEDILTQVIEARAQATQTTIDADNLGDAQQFRQFEAAQNNLGGALSRLMVVVERYPELQSQQRFADLMVALEGTENRIDNARTKYNEAVRDYNTTIRTFPDTIGANIIHGAERMETFQAEAGADQAVDVDFGDMDPVNEAN